VIANLGELRRRRAELIERSTALRAALAHAAAPIVQKAAAADRIVAPLRRHPLIIAVTLGVVAVAGTRRLVPWLTRAFALYALLKRI
jgi:hypothetical protein